MKQSTFTAWMITAVVLAGAPAAPAQEFSRSLRPEDFAAAGLGKLSTGELARLDALVRAYRPVPPAPAARQAATSSATVAAAAPQSGAKVVRVAPGTTIEFEETESRLVGKFNGWEPRMIFNLENGQRWQVLDTEPYSGRTVMSPVVKITPGVLGSFWMTIEGADRRVKVRRVAAP